MPHSVFSCRAIYSLIDLLTGGKTYCAQFLVMLCHWDAGSKHDIKLFMLLLGSVLVLQRKSILVFFFKFWTHFLLFLHSCSPYLLSCWATSRVTYKAKLIYLYSNSTLEIAMALPYFKLFLCEHLYVCTCMCVHNFILRIICLQQKAYALPLK